MDTIESKITEPIPVRMQSLPVDERGYVVPWFVDWVDGKPEFRALESKIESAETLYWTTEDIARAEIATRRQVQLWDERGLIPARHPDRGTWRRYSFDEVLLLAVIAELRKRHVAMPKLERSIHKIRTALRNRTRTLYLFVVVCGAFRESVRPRGVVTIHYAFTPEEVIRYGRISKGGVKVVDVRELENKLAKQPKSKAAAA